MTDFTYQDASHELGCSVGFLEDHIDELPHQKYGGRNGRVMFTAAQLDEIRQIFERRPLTTATGAGLFLEPTANSRRQFGRAS